MCQFRIALRATEISIADNSMCWVKIEKWNKRHAVAVQRVTTPRLICFWHSSVCVWQRIFQILFRSFVHSFSLITVRYTAPVENIFWKRDAMKPIGQKIVKLLRDMNFDAHPLIIHLFSNGGAYLYQNIDVAVKEMQTPLDVSTKILFPRFNGFVASASLSLSTDLRHNFRFGTRRSPFDGIISGHFTNIRKGSTIQLSHFIVHNIWFGNPLGGRGKCRDVGHENYRNSPLKLIFLLNRQDAFKAVRGAFSTPIETNPYTSLKNLVNYTPQLFLYSDQDKLIPATVRPSSLSHSYDRN